MKNILFFFCVLLVTAEIGCTFTFKATDIEASGNVRAEYELDEIYVANIKVIDLKENSGGSPQ
jgi:archaellum component FlaG (FlaF/FlaG flagellin family)